MATKRKPATAGEVMEFFDAADLSGAEMLYQLVGVSLKRRRAEHATLCGVPKPQNSVLPGEPAEKPGPSASEIREILVGSTA